MPTRALALIALLIVMLAGCASKPTPILSFLPPDVPADTEITWPPPPETARYRYVGELIGEDNFVSASPEKRNVATRFLRWVVGLGSRKQVKIELQRPQAVMVDAAGRVFVSDVSRQAVYVFDRVAGKLRVWARAAEGLPFMAPIGIATTPDGGLLVADAGLGEVIQLDPDGEPVGRFGKGDLVWPTGLARDPESGTIYVVDSQAHDIKVYNDSGQLQSVIGKRGEGAGEFNGPTFLSFVKSPDKSRLYVTDTLNTRIQVLTPEGQVERVFGKRGLFFGDMPRPKGVGVDREGRVYVVESYYDYLLIFNAQGEFLMPIGGTGSGIGQFYQPAGVWIDGQTIYVADMFNGRVVIFEYLDTAGDEISEGVQEGHEAL